MKKLSVLLAAVFICAALGNAQQQAYNKTGGTVSKSKKTLAISEAEATVPQAEAVVPAKANAGVSFGSASKAKSGGTTAPSKSGVSYGGSSGGSSRSVTQGSGASSSTTATTRSSTVSGTTGTVANAAGLAPTINGSMLAGQRLTSACSPMRACNAEIDSFICSRTSEETRKLPLVLIQASCDWADYCTGSVEFYAEASEAKPEYKTWHYLRMYYDTDQTKGFNCSGPGDDSFRAVHMSVDYTGYYAIKRCCPNDGCDPGKKYNYETKSCK